MKKQVKSVSKPDISISGSLGFYTIQPTTDAGKDWLLENVPSIWDAVTPWEGVYCDDTRMVEDIAEGAHDDGIVVEVNDSQYLGNNRVAMPKRYFISYGQEQVATADIKSARLEAKRIAKGTMYAIRIIHNGDVIETMKPTISKSGRVTFRRIKGDAA